MRRTVEDLLVTLFDDVADLRRQLRLGDRLDVIRDRVSSHLGLTAYIHEVVDLAQSHGLLDSLFERLESAFPNRADEIRHVRRGSRVSAKLAAPGYLHVLHEDSDKLEVLDLCRQLTLVGVRVWFDAWDADPSAEREEQVLASIDSAPGFLVCIGANGLAPSTCARVTELGQSRPVHVVRLPGAPRVELEGRFRLHDLAECLDLDAELRASFGDLVDKADPRARLAREAQRTSGGAQNFSPFRGLRAFAEPDARWMWGRDAEVAGLLEQIRESATRFIAVVGASGSGKSSLVRAGVCPLVRHGGLGEGKRWTIGYLRPGLAPCSALAHVLVDLDRSCDSAIERAALAKTAEHELLETEDALARITQQLVGRAPNDDQRLLLVVDQLEELVTQADATHARAFADNLRHLSLHSTCVCVVATIRSDFLHRCLEFPGIAEATAGLAVAVPPLREDQIRDAIVGPLARLDVHVEAKLLERLVVETAGRAGRLPLLQFKLDELWRDRPSGRSQLSFEQYEASGGVERAVANAADHAIETLRESYPNVDFTVRRVLTRLVHIDESGAHTRCQAKATNIGSDPETNLVLERLTNWARVLVAGVSEDDDVVYEIAHEALLSSWDPLIEWLDANRRALRVRQELLRSATKYEAQRSPEYLWGPGRVEHAREVLRASGVDLNERETGFLAACDRSNRRRRMRAVAGVATLSAMFFLTLALFFFERDARSQAEEAREEAQAHLTEALLQRAQFLVQLGREALASHRPDRAARFALAAMPDAMGMDSPPLPGAVAVLRSAFELGLGTLGDNALPVRALVTLHDGRLVTGGRNGVLKVWNAAGTQCTTIGRHAGTLSALTAVSDKRIVSGGHSGALTAWTVDGSSKAEIGRLGGGVTALSAFADGRLVSAGRGGEIRLWDSALGSSQLLQPEGAEVNTVDTLPDGRIATGDEDGFILLWDTEGGPGLALAHVEQPVVALAATQDGDLVSADREGTLRIHKLRGSSVLLGRHGGAVQALVAVGKQQVASCGEYGAIRLWTLGEETSQALGRHAGSANDVAVLLDGRLVSGGDDGLVRTWSAAGEKGVEVGPPGEMVTTLSLLADGRVVSGASDGAVRLWAIDEGTSAELGKHREGVEALVPLGDGRFVSAGGDGLRLWATDGTQTELGRHATLALADIGGGRFLSTGNDGVVRIWTVDTGESVRLGGTPETVVVAAGQGDGRVVTANTDGELRSWAPDGSGRRGLVEIGRHPGTKVLALLPDGRIVSAGSDGVLQAWTLGSASPEALGRHPGTVYALARLDDQRLASAGANGVVQVWTTREEGSFELAPHRGLVRGLVVLRDGRLLGAGFDGVLRVWTTHMWADQQVIERVREDLPYTDLSADERRLAFLPPRTDPRSQ